MTSDDSLPRSSFTQRDPTFILQTLERCLSSGDRTALRRLSATVEAHDVAAPLRLRVREAVARSALGARDWPIFGAAVGGLLADDAGLSGSLRDELEALLVLFHACYVGASHSGREIGQLLQRRGRKAVGTNLDLALKVAIAVAARDTPAFAKCWGKATKDQRLLLNCAQDRMRESAARAYIKAYHQLSMDALQRRLGWAEMNQKCSKKQVLDVVFAEKPELSKINGGALELQVVRFRPRR